jgi:hypothetical protein
MASKPRTMKSFSPQWEPQISHNDYNVHVCKYRPMNFPDI